MRFTVGAEIFCRLRMSRLNIVVLVPRRRAISRVLGEWYHASVRLWTWGYQAVFTHSNASPNPLRSKAPTKQLKLAASERDV